MYAPRLMSAAWAEMDKRCVRASLVHYNTLGEVARFADALEDAVRAERAA